MKAETLHLVVSFLIEKPHVYGVIIFVVIGIYILFLAGKVMRSEDSNH